MLREKMKKIALPLLLVMVITVTGCGGSEDNTADITEEPQVQSEQVEEASEDGDEGTVIAEEPIKEPSGKAKVKATGIPKYSGKPYVEINGNKPGFTKKDMTEKPFEKYSSMDRLGRCQVAYANICQDIMPTEKRGGIGQVKPSGWHTVRYDDIIPERYLYNRCHLIGYQLAGENANEENLITGTRYFNVEGMLPFEDEVADYVDRTDNHVLYRVTPVYKGDNLVATGVQMEAKSVEDNGRGVEFNVFVYNVQPDIVIDYETGESRAAKGAAKKSNNSSKSGNTEKKTYVVNLNTKKYHREDCRSIKQMSAKNKKVYKGTSASLQNNGYSPCGNCHP